MKEIALLGVGLALGYVLCREKYKALKAMEAADHKNCNCCYCKDKRAGAEAAAA